MFFLRLLGIPKHGDREPLIRAQGRLSDENNPKLKDFIENVKRLRKRVDPKDPEYDPFIFMTVEGGATSLSNEILLNAYDRILEEYSKGKLDDLHSQQGITFKRNKSNRFKFNSAVRSIAVLCNDDGEFELYVRPKSKLNFNFKRIIKWPGGSYKKCKVAFLISKFPFVPCADLLFKIPDLSREVGKYEHAQDLQEHKFAQELSSLFPECFPKASMFLEKKGKGVWTHRFIPHVQFDLFKLLLLEQEKPQVFAAVAPGLDTRLVQFGKLLVPAWKLDIMRQILVILKNLESAKIAHRDLKPENLLIQFDSGRPVVRCIDFGLSSRYQYEAERVGTPVFAPPESAELRYRNYLALFIKILDDNKLNIQNGIREAQERFEEYADEHPDDLATQITRRNLDVIDAVKLLRTTKKDLSSEHDRWSTGIVLFTLLLGRFPKLDRNIDDAQSALDKALCDCEGTPIIGLLQLAPELRVSANDALQEFDKLVPDDLENIKTTPQLHPLEPIDTSTVPLEAIKCLQQMADLKSMDFVKIFAALSNIDDYFQTLQTVNTSNSLRGSEGLKRLNENISLMQGFVALYVRPIYEVVQSLLHISDPNERKKFIKKQVSAKLKHSQHALNNLRRVQKQMKSSGYLNEYQAASVVMLQMRIGLLEIAIATLEQQCKAKPNNAKIDALVSNLIPDFTRGVATLHMMDKSFNARFSAKF